MKVRLMMTVTAGMCLLAQACAASPGNVVPDEVRAFVAPTDTLLAYKAADLYGDASPAAVIVVRHPVTEKNDYDFDNNPCELAVLHQEHGKLVKVDGSKKAVDCTYNDVARRAPAMSLNDNLKLKPGNIVYVNQKAKGDSTFTFGWSTEKKAWYLQQATASNPSGTQVTNPVASYPKDFPWTPMPAVDPEALADILEKHAKTTK